MDKAEALALGLPDAYDLDHWIASVNAFLGWRAQTGREVEHRVRHTVFNEDFFKWWFQPQDWKGIVVDIGCGGGAVWHMVKNVDAILGYYGIDPLERLAPATSVCSGRHTIIYGVGEKLSAEIPMPVDVVTCFSVFQHCYSPEMVVAEAARVLRPGGMFYGTVCTGPASELNHREFKDAAAVAETVCTSDFILERGYMFERGLYAFAARRV